MRGPGLVSHGAVAKKNKESQGPEILASGARTKLFASWLKLSATTPLAAASKLRFRPGRWHQHHRNIGPTAADGSDDVRLDQCRLPSSNRNEAKCHIATLAMPRQAFLFSDVDGPISVFAFPA
jgi:hypothetical protein